MLYIIISHIIYYLYIKNKGIYIIMANILYIIKANI